MMGWWCGGEIEGKRAIINSIQSSLLILNFFKFSLNLNHFNKSTLVCIFAHFQSIYVVLYSTYYHQGMYIGKSFGWTKKREINCNFCEGFRSWSPPVLHSAWFDLLWIDTQYILNGLSTPNGAPLG